MQTSSKIRTTKTRTKPMFKTLSSAPTVKARIEGSELGGGKTVSIPKKLRMGEITAYVTGDNKIWCAWGAHWADADKCAVIDNFIKCEDCIKNEVEIDGMEEK